MRAGRRLVVSIGLAAAITVNGLTGVSPALAQPQIFDGAPLVAAHYDPDACAVRQDAAPTAARAGRTKPSWMPQWIWDAIHGDDAGDDPCYPGEEQDLEPDDPNDPDWLPPWDEPTWEPEAPDPEQPEEPDAPGVPDQPEEPQPEVPDDSSPQPEVPEPDHSEAPQPEQPEEPQPGPEATPDPTPEAPQPEAPWPEGPRHNRGNIAALLTTLETRPVDTRERYRRDAFGKSWGDPDGNRCNTRNDILARDLRDVKKRDHCKVLSGVLYGPYTKKTIHFTSGRYTSDDVQIDHVVAVRDAWQTGAQNLDKEMRIYFYNDPLNLLAVDGPTNTRKGSKNAAQWLPPNTQFHCEYVGRQIAVKARYHLWVTQEERNAMIRVLNHCPTDMRVEGNTIVGAQQVQG